MSSMTTSRSSGAHGRGATADAESDHMRARLEDLLEAQSYGSEATHAASGRHGAGYEDGYAEYDHVETDEPTYADAEHGHAFGDPGRIAEFPAQAYAETDYPAEYPAEYPVEYAPAYVEGEAGHAQGEYDANAFAEGYERPEYAANTYADGAYEEGYGEYDEAPKRGMSRGLLFGVIAVILAVAAVIAYMRLRPTQLTGYPTAPGTIASPGVLPQNAGINPQTGQPYPQSQINPQTGQPYPQSQLNPQGQINPQTGLPYPQGTGVGQPGVGGLPNQAVNGPVDWASVAQFVGPSIVSLRLSSTGATLGSGIIVASTGEILTNAHLVTAAALNGIGLQATLYNGQVVPATVVGVDRPTDLALIRLQNPPQGLPAVAFANTSILRVGDPVLALGSASANNQTATTGVISAIQRPAINQAADGTGVQTNVLVNMIGTDAPVSSADTGGALVNRFGQVVGIPTNVMVDLFNGNGTPGNFAVPANTARNVALALMTTGRVDHAYFGASLVNGTSQVNGVQTSLPVISQVAQNTPAAVAGIQAGDAILAIDGMRVATADALAASLAEKAPNTQVVLSVVRSSQITSVRVTLGTRISN